MRKFFARLLERRTIERSVVEIAGDALFYNAALMSVTLSVLHDVHANSILWPVLLGVGILISTLAVIFQPIVSTLTRRTSAEQHLRSEYPLSATREITLAELPDLTPVTFHFATNETPPLASVARLFRAMQKDFDRLADERDLPRQALVLLETGSGSWWVRVGLPVIGITISAAALMNDLVSDHPASFAGTVKEMCELASATNSDVRITMDGGPAIEISCGEARKKLLDREGESERQGSRGKPPGMAIVNPLVVLPSGSAIATFTGMLSTEGDDMILAPQISPKPFPYIDTREEPEPLIEGRMYVFGAALRRTWHGVLIGAEIHSAAPLC